MVNRSEIRSRAKINFFIHAPPFLSAKAEGDFVSGRSPGLGVITQINLLSLPRSSPVA